MRVTSPLSPTTRSSPRREKERAQTDRATLYDVLDASLVCHLGVVVDGVPQDRAPVEGTVVDVTGAGDALAAGYLLGGPDLAMLAAGRCVARRGAQPEPRR